MTSDEILNRIHEEYDAFLTAHLIEPNTVLMGKPAIALLRAAPCLQYERIDTSTYPYDQVMGMRVVAVSPCPALIRVCLMVWADE